MDDPTRRCENDTDKWKRATRGSCSQARAPFFCPSGTAISGCPFLVRMDFPLTAMEFKPNGLRSTLAN